MTRSRIPATLILLAAVGGSAPAAAQLPTPVSPACQTGTITQQAACQAKLLPISPTWPSSAPASPSGA